MSWHKDTLAKVCRYSVLGGAASLSGCAVVTVTSAVVGAAVSVTTTAVGLAVDGTVAAGKGVVAVGGMATDAMSSKPSASEASAVSVRPSP